MAYNRDNYLQAIARMLGGTPMEGLNRAMIPTFGGALAREAAREAAMAGARPLLEQDPVFQPYEKIEPAITPAMAARYIGNRAFAPVNQPSGLNLSNRGYPSSFGAPTMSVTRGR